MSSTGQVGNIEAPATPTPCYSSWLASLRSLDDRLDACSLDARGRARREEPLLPSSQGTSVGLSGCAESEAGETADRARQLIAGGNTVFATFSKDMPEAAVGLLRTTGGGICSASVIQRDLILSAAHCVCSNPNAQRDFWLPTFPTDANGNATTIPIAGQPLWWGTESTCDGKKGISDKGKTRDLALMFLSRPIAVSELPSVMPVYTGGFFRSLQEPPVPPVRHLAIPPHDHRWLRGCPGTGSRDRYSRGAGLATQGNTGERGQAVSAVRVRRARVRGRLRRRDHVGWRGAAIPRRLWRTHHLPGRRQSRRPVRRVQRRGIRRRREGGRRTVVVSHLGQWGT